VAIRFRVEGDLRFISHHDTMRLFERALARAQLPVKFSEGFNPRPRMSLPLPRPVGMATSADVLVIELHEPTGPSVVLDRLREQMPAGLELVDAFELEAARKLHVERVNCEVALAGDQVEAARAAVDRVLAAESWPVQRTDERGRVTRSIDLRPLLIEASVEPGALRWSHRVSDGGSARPGEWLQAFGLEPAEHLHRVRRTEIHWQTEPPAGPPPRSAELAGALANAEALPTPLTAALVDMDVPRSSG
jgi:radical SAM-linked protein